MAIVCFSHGKESGPRGTKIIAMTEVAEKLGFKTISIDYRGIDSPEERVNKLLSEIPSDEDQIILVGSSMGSYVSIVASKEVQPEGLFLLAPAVYLKGYDSVELIPHGKKIFVMHGWNDEIVPCANAIKFAEKFKTDLYLCDDDHRLSGSTDLLKKEFRQFLKLLKKL